MLVLSRKKNESIDIGKSLGLGIEIVVVEIRGDKVRLGIQAPDHIPVHRREVSRAIEKEENLAKGYEHDQTSQSKE